MLYQPRPVVFDVSFATESGVMKTLEGAVNYRAGDAIMTGVRGENWPIPRAKFLAKYAPEPGTHVAAAGRYRKRQAFVLAQQLQVDTEVMLTDDQGTLHGAAGDWCVTYGFGNQAVIRNDIFAATYQPADRVPVFIAIDAVGLAANQAVIAEAEGRLRQVLPQTPVFCLPVEDETASVPWWFRVQAGAGNEAYESLPQGRITMAMFVGLDGGDSLSNHILRIRRHSSHWLRFSLERIRGFLSSLFGHKRKHEELEVLAVQLIAVDEFNRELAQPNDNDYFIKRYPTGAPEPLRRAGAVADKRAGEYQRRWQRLVLADTKTISGLALKKGPIWLWSILKLLMSPSLVTLGLLAAVGLVAFSELTRECRRNDLFSWIGCANENWSVWMEPLTFAFYLTALLVAWVRYAQAKTRQLENRHQDYRLLAECSRVQYLLSVLGRGECVVDDLSMARNDDSGWVLRALHSMLYVQRPRYPLPETLEPAAFEWAMENFVRDQRKYHQDILISRREAAANVLTRAGQLGFFVFLAALILIAFDLFHSATAPVDSMGKHILLILQIAGLAFWGGMRKTLDVFGLEHEAQRGEMVLHALHCASGATLERPEALFSAIRIFVHDQAAWHALHSTRPVEAATGG